MLETNLRIGDAPKPRASEFCDYLFVNRRSLIEKYTPQSGFKFRQLLTEIFPI